MLREPVANRPVSLPDKKVIHFTKCSSPELDATLKTIKEAIVLPTYLANEERRKIYDIKNEAVLQRDPVTMVVDGELVEFRYRSFTDLPNTNMAVRSAVMAMKTPGDFNNLWPLLEGVCGQANRNLDPAILCRAIRGAAMAECLPVILECIQGVKKTGFRLNRHEIVNQLLFALQDDALNSGWNKAETAKALKRIQLVLDLLEGEPEHRALAVRPGVELPFPLYRDPMVLAARLHIEAALAVKHQQGKDVDGLVAKHTQQLVQLWPEATGLLDLQPKTVQSSNKGTKYLVHGDQFITFGSMVLSGLRLAAKVVEPELAGQLEKRAALLEEQINTVLHGSNAPSERSLGIHNKLLNEEPVEA